MILGYILTSASQNVETLAVGQLFSNIGVSSIGFINGIVMADISPLKWRALATAIFSAPPIVNAFIAAPIVEGVLGRGVDHWRWGYAIFLVRLVLAHAVAERDVKGIDARLDYSPRGYGPYFDRPFLG